ncbi:MAG: alpha/beta hydrolase [Reichenbachiella sp.]|uniref:alpha/beta hydrolase n=1 Tax=Reichenbachiella sp. TaxID=2184521 RepID=UPI00329A3AFD
MNYTSLGIGLAIVFSLFLLYNLFFVLFYENVLFQGDELNEDHAFDFKFPYEEVSIDTEDNARLHGLLLKSDSSKGLILYFHGNRGNLERWGQIANDIRNGYNYDVLVMDYRGYGKSRGNRNEQALYQDATVVYDYAIQQLGYDQIVIHGRSLGTAIATYLAANRKAAHLILETPMTNIRAVIPVLDFLLFKKTWLRYEFNSLSRIDAISCPITIFHGTDDRIVPYDLGYQLYLGIDQPNKKIITINQGKHNNLDTFEIYQQAMERILK